LARAPELAGEDASGCIAVIIHTSDNEWLARAVYWPCRRRIACSFAGSLCAETYSAKALHGWSSLYGIVTLPHSCIAGSYAYFRCCGNATTPLLTPALKHAVNLISRHQRRRLLIIATSMTPLTDFESLLESFLGKYRRLEPLP
jgi:hypothetical protein